MKKTRIKQRVENAFNAFFDDENLAADNTLTYARVTNLSHPNASKIFMEKAERLVKALKRVFIFFPGTFILFYVTLGTILFFSQMMTSYGDAQRLVWVYLTGLASVFMTWFGLGNIKKLKHGVIPLSIILTAVVIGTISVATSSIISLHEKLTKDFNYAVLLFPLALVVPFLAKGWIDRRSKDFE